MLLHPIQILKNSLYIKYKITLFTFKNHFDSLIRFLFNSLFLNILMYSIFLNKYILVGSLINFLNLQIIFECLKLIYQLFHFTYVLHVLYLFKIGLTLTIKKLYSLLRIISAF